MATARFAGAPLLIGLTLLVSLNVELTSGYASIECDAAGLGRAYADQVAVISMGSLDVNRGG